MINIELIYSWEHTLKAILEAKINTKIYKNID